VADWPDWAERVLWKATEWPIVRPAAEWVLNETGAVPYHGDRFTGAKFRSDRTSSEPGTPAFEPAPAVRQVAHELRQLAGDIYKADLVRAGAAADAREASGAAHDPKIYVADMERAVSDRAAREHATYRYEMAPVPDWRVIEEAFGDLARTMPTPEQRVQNTMDASKAKAEIAHASQDLGAARQEQAGDLLQQTLAIGRQVEAQTKQSEQKSATKGRRMQA
jgi:hypothetical protein